MSCQNFQQDHQEDEAPERKSGYPWEGAKIIGDNIRQRFLKITTDPLHYVPAVQFPDPTSDRFFYLQKEGQLLDGSLREIPNLQGMSGASLWASSEPAELWTPSKALKVVAVQSSFKRGEWFRCTDWAAIIHLFRRIGFKSPP